MSDSILKALGLEGHPRVVKASEAASRGAHLVHNPTTGAPIAGVTLDTAASYDATVAASVKAFESWRSVPAPQRGLVVRAMTACSSSGSVVEAELVAREHRPEQLGNRHRSIVGPASEGRGDVGLFVGTGSPRENREEGLVGDFFVVG